MTWIQLELFSVLASVTCVLTVAGRRGVMLDDGSWLEVEENLDEIDRNTDSGLFPVVFNLARRASITSNATCGSMGSEEYCRLIEHVNRPYDELESVEEQCGVCVDGSHPIENAIDGTQSWWQSPTIAQGYDYHYVTVTLDLKQVYQVAYVIIKAANAPRPGNWILERSIDGVDFKPWQYFALTDSDCWNKYSIPPTVGYPQFQNDDDVICTSYYSRLNPLRNGEIHISLVNGRPGVSEPTQELLDFTTARYIRLRLQRIRTLYADLMTFAYSQDARLVDPTVTNRYFYSIKDISVGGQCICYGHARYCPVDPVTGELKCECESNTCGNSCEMCCPLFNQQLWKPGTFNEKSTCEECQCYGHADACEYNSTVADMGLSINTQGEYIGGGVCIECKNNHMGINCEICEDGFYLPEGVDLRHPHSCRPCHCEGPGTTGMCVKDASRIAEGIRPGDCLCKEGFCGPMCDACALGYRNYPHCEPCDCNAAGSVNVDTCEDQCMCKQNVEGSKCDTCIEGSYNLQATNPDGCDRCFCFGITDMCKSSTWHSTIIHSMVGWEMTDLVNSGRLPTRRTHNGALYLNTVDMDRLNSATYWLAPKQFTGNRVKSYGGTLTYTFSYGTDLTVNSTEPYLANPDVILEGSSVRIGYNGEYFEEDVMHDMKVIMAETHWRHLQNSTSSPDSSVSREDFLLILGDVSRFLIRSAYHLHQTSVFLHNVGLDTASIGGSGAVMGSVEICQCPAGYAGTSCERCAAGFRRVANVLVGGTCEPCQCYGHSQSCDPYSGECFECMHNTQGSNCEKCVYGHYGDATLGTPDACRPCACPLTEDSNNFAEGCILSDETQGDYLCIGCKMGFEGERCERCSPGFYGDPMIPGNYCLPCNCHGNQDPGYPDICDGLTGECLQCTGFTEGYHCESCIEGYYGTAQDGDCRPCNCDPNGSTGDRCDRYTGQCHCLPRFGGRDCSQCEDGYGNVELGCPHCKCDEIGSVSQICDSLTGQCPCHPGVSGIHCSQCSADHYGFSTDGCYACNCDPLGSLSSTCDSLTGDCSCKPNVTGTTCDQCKADHWGFTSGKGCKPCGCSPVGAYSQQCDPYSGECQCREGIASPQCLQCEVGYYGFSQYGCKKCGSCPLPGQVCDPEDGDCVCPRNTEGEECERCIPNTWGYNPHHGCMDCECSKYTSESSQCDVVTGKCQCRGDYRGDKCDKCPAGYYSSGFPYCDACDCDPAGVDPDQCETEKCDCNQYGECPCKANVAGDKCSYCAERSFSLRSDNPVGCTTCFCFGKSDQCTQAAYAWNTRMVPSQKIELSMSALSDLRPSSHGFLVVPEGETKLFIKSDHARLPLYWELPSTWHKDQTLSYNGYLRFNRYVTYYSGIPDSENSPWPLVHLIGNFRLHLYYHPINGQDGTHDVLMREDMWRDSTGNPVERDVFMIALQNVHHWLIKVGDEAANIVDASLEDISLEYAQPVKDNEDINAWGIEQCQCPPEYDGLSCQNPASGYYRERPDDFLDMDDPMSLIGDSTPCTCYGHSNECNPDTGICLNCQHNTFGDNCELCQDGYYGDATTATPNSCHRCGCPLTLASNNFSPTCVHDIYTGDYYCDACPEGYEGVHCERCSLGYFGSPSAYGSRCEQCQCDPEGSRSNVCDEVTGQCDCFPGIEGRQCDRCQEHHVVANGGCEYCLDGCTGELYTYAHDLEKVLNDFNSSASALLPWARMNIIEAQVPRLRGVLKASNKTAYRDVYAEINSMREKARRVSAEAALVMGSNQGNANEMESLAKEIEMEAENSEPEIEETWRDAAEFVEDLRREVREKLSESANGIGDMEDALRLAEAILSNAVQSDFTEQLEEANIELKMARTLEEQVENLKVQYSQLNTTEERKQAIDVVEKLEDLIMNANDARVVNRGAKGKSKDNNDELEELRAIIAILKAEENEVVECLGAASYLSENASHALWNESSSNYEASEDMLAELRAARGDIERKVGLLEQNLPISKDLLDKALVHAKELEDQAIELQENFEETKNAAEDPLKATHVYEDIEKSIASAEDAVMKAADAAKNASESINNLPDGSLVDQTEEALNRSKALYDDSSNTQKKMREMGNQLQEQVNTNDDTEYDNQRQTVAIDEINRIMDDLRSDETMRAQEARDRAMDVKDRVGQVDEQVEEIVDKTENELRPKIEELLAVQEEGLQEAHRSVLAAKQRFAKISNLTSVLESKHSEIERVGKDLTQNILALKEKIQVARAQANSIKVSLSHDSSCARRYEVEPEQSTSNAVTLFFKTNDTTQPMSLFMLRNPNNSDFLALELVRGRVRMEWDTGAGVTSIVHDLVIKPTEAGTNINQWYQVTAHRVSNIGHLSVKNLNDKMPAFVVNASSPGSHIQLTVTKDTDLYLGGLPDDYKLPGNLEARGFSGCMGGVKIGVKRYGMYNFRHLEGDGCKGCLVVPIPASSSSGVFSTDGTGFVEIPQVRYDPGSYSIILEFKGFWEEALLFFTANQENGDFISLELRGGKIVYSFGTDFQTLLSLSTRYKYNTNEWVRVRASRLKRQGLLQINDGAEIVTNSAPEGSRERLLLSDEKVYISGVPATQNVDRFGVTDVSFLGCLRDIQLVSKASLTQDLLSGKYTGLQAGCTNPSPEIGFHGNGHVELPSADLTRNGGFGLTFRTLKANGLLLLAQGTKGDNFYSVSLLNGKVESWYSAGSGIVKIESNKMYNDGVEHTVNIVKENRLIQMYIDDDLIGNTRLPSGAARINSMKGEEGGLFIGGTGEMDAGGKAASTDDFEGCIYNLNVNGELAVLNNPVNFNQADIGRCDADQLFPNMTEGGVKPTIPSFTVTVTLPETRTTTTMTSLITTTTPPGPTVHPDACAIEPDPSHVNAAVRFGDLLNSHREILLEGKAFKDFNVSLEFRTFHREGVVFYIENPEQTQYLALLLMDGNIHVQFGSDGVMRVIQNDIAIGDGRWHSIYLEKTKRTVALRVDGESAESQEIGRKLDVTTSILVGGFPKTFVPSAGVEGESFKGCMRQFTMNGDSIDLANTAGEVMGVGRCFTYVEPGIHFNGFGYATYEEQFRITDKFRITMEFRTVMQEGIIITISHPHGDPALALELFGGKLIFRVISKGKTLEVEAGECEFCLCDDRWHSVIAEFEDNGIKLKVDQGPLYQDTATEDMVLNTNYPLYIGGYPSYDPQEALSHGNYLIGCLRNLRINDVLAHWHGMDDLRDVHVSACPRPNPLLW